MTENVTLQYKEINFVLSIPSYRGNNTIKPTPILIKTTHNIIINILKSERTTSSEIRKCKISKDDIIIKEIYWPGKI